MSRPLVGVVVLLSTLPAVACVTVGRSGPPPSPATLAQLWVEPDAERSLVRGAGGDDPVPAPGGRYDVLHRDTSGFSITYRVRDAKGRKWAVKIGPEAQTEVVSSRIVWALGYHEVPSDFVERWTAVEHGRAHLLGGSRFRPDDLPHLDARGDWSWQHNPFVGARPYNGLLVLMLILNSTDLKNDNNKLYEVKGPPREGARRWYVVKDLGATLGETGRVDPHRNWLEGFEREPFITGTDGPFVRFAYRGRHQELIDHRLTPADVRWTCRRLQRLTDRQWHDAFRAAHYTDEQAARYVDRIRQKIAEGLALP